MITTFGSISTAKLGIRASQQGLQITGNNITNINTAGYTRQRINQVSLRAGVADRYASSTDIRMGSGTLVVSVSQIRDPFLDIRYRNEAANVGYFDSKLSGMDDLKSVLDEVMKNGIHTNIEGLLDKLNELSTNVGKPEFDNLVQGEMKSLVSLLNKYASDLNTQRDNAIEGFTQDVKKANEILTQIRDLNIEIRNSQIHGDNALEMRDRRNELIDQLSEFTKIKVTYSQEQVSSGIFVERLTIEMDGPNTDPANRPTLVDGSFANQFQERVTEDKEVEISLGGLTNLEGKSPLEQKILDQMDKLNKSFQGLQKANQQAQANTQRKEQWLQTIKELDESYTEDTFSNSETYRTEREKLDQAIEAARQAAAADPGNQELKDALKAATDKRNAFTNAREEYSKINAEKSRITSDQQAFQSAITTVLNEHAQAAGIGVPQLQFTNNADTGVVSVQITIGEQTINFDGLNTPPNFSSAPAEDPATGLNLSINGQSYGNVTQQQMDTAADVTDNENTQRNLYGVLLADVEHLNSKGAFDTPPSTIRGIGYYQKAMDSFAQTLAKTFNDINNLQSNPEGQQLTGQELLTTRDGQTDISQITAANISISEGWLNGTVKINASTNPRPDSSSSDNSNILNMISALNKPLNFYVNPGAENPDDPSNILFNGTFEQMYVGVNNTLGQDMRTTNTMLNNAAASATERAISRENVSTVDLNEEGINLIQYQKSFAASCRVMTTLDQMLDSLLNMGVVGR